MNNSEKLLSWYSSISKDSLHEIDKYYELTAFFKDPFNEISGCDNIFKIFEEMFLKLENPKFKFIDVLNDGDSCFTTWDFMFSIKGKKFKIHGSSHLKFNENGKVVYHRDYWDVGEELFLKVPLLKTIYGAFRNKIGIS